MAINNEIRLLSIGLAIALSAANCNGQTAPAAPGDTPGSENAAAAWPKTAAELPPSLPKVTCNGGQLTMTGSAGTIKYVEALYDPNVTTNTSVNTGTIDWAPSSWTKIQAGATLPSLR